jgi:hypothetical protein
MSLTNTYENTVLDWLLTTDAATRPTSWYVGLFTSDPTETGAALPKQVQRVQRSLVVHMLGQQ